MHSASLRYACQIFEAIIPAEVAIVVGKGVSFIDHCERGVNGPPPE